MSSPKGEIKMHEELIKMVRSLSSGIEISKEKLSRYTTNQLESLINYLTANKVEGARYDKEFQSTVN